MRILKSIVPAPQETIAQCPERRSMMRMTFAKAPPSPPSQPRAGSGGIGLCCWNYFPPRFSYPGKSPIPYMYKKENLAKLKKMDSLAPQVMKAFWAFDKAAVADGAIPVKYKELIAVAVALTTQCPYCIDIHTGNARKAGATDAEIAEAAMVAAALRAGAAVTHATHALSD